MTAFVVFALVMVATAPWALADRTARARMRGIAAPGEVPAQPLRGITPAACEPLEAGVLLELIGAAVRAGASIPRALDAVGRAVGGADGAGLQRAAAAVVMGASWSSAWADVPARLDVVRRALAPAWEHGAAPSESLRAAGTQLRAQRQARAKVAAAKLAVRLVVPLGACFLPAFVLIGLLPLLISLASGLLGG